MRKATVLSIVMALLLFAGSSSAPSSAQDSSNDRTPTFYRLAPGTYVNPWPRFTVTYPKDWAEAAPLPQEVFRVAAPGAYGDMYSVFVVPPQAPRLERAAEVVVGYFEAVAKGVKVVNNKPSQMRDGSPAQEVQISAILNGLPFDYLFLVTKKSDLWFGMGVGSFGGGVKDSLRALLYSAEFTPGKDEPVTLPADIHTFLDAWCNDLVGHDLTKIMAHYSDTYLKSGTRKGEMERFWREGIGPITSFEVGITDFVAEGDKTYLAGYSIINGAKWPLAETSIIKENGEWKWYGNQRDPLP